MNVKVTPFGIQFLGAVIVVAACIFWAVTNRESALIIGSGMAMFGVGEMGKLRITLTRDDQPTTQGKELEVNGSDS